MRVADPPDGRRSLSAAAAKLVLAVCAISLALVQTFGTATVEISAVELRDIVLLGAVVNTVLLAAALVLLRSRFRNAALALVTTGSIASSNMVHTDLVRAENRVLLALAALAIGSGLFAAFELIESSRLLRGGSQRLRCWLCRSLSCRIYRARVQLDTLRPGTS